MALSLNTLHLRRSHEAFNFDRVKRHVELNQSMCVRKLGLSDARVTGSLLDPRRYTFDGSLWVETSQFARTAPDYLLRSRRSLAYGNRTVLRGTRYTISSNPTFELRQKLDDLVEDFEEGLNAIIGVRDRIYTLAIADYLKNVVITFLNSLIAGEKIGNFAFTNTQYQSLRREAQTLAYSVCELFYGIMLNSRPVFDRAYKVLAKSGLETIKRIEDRILREYRDGSFSSRHISRPEASHPLVIGGFATRLALNTRIAPDTILGMPAGATEVVMASAVAFKSLRGIDASVLLFPASLHSIKHDFDDGSGDPSHVEALVHHYRSKLRSKRVLIIDDNSSTGRTLDVVSKKVSQAKPKQVDCFVAEADIVRTKQRLADKSIRAVAAPIAYSMAVNVLPVSSHVSPRHDLKQLNERRRMISCVRQRYLGTEQNPINRLLGELYVDLLKNPNTSDDLPNQIKSFRKTFLSNFSEVEVELAGVSYSSVEHAYQRAKLSENALDALTDEHIRIINKKLASRNAEIEKKHVISFFSNPDLPAGTSKVVGNQLRILGFVRSDWDHIKLPIMIALLIQKFSKKRFYALLKDTSDKDLVEGNDWGDTFWGVSGGRGRNVLGRLLMLLREFRQSELVDISRQVEAQGIPNFTEVTALGLSKAPA